MYCLIEDCGALWEEGGVRITRCVGAGGEGRAAGLAELVGADSWRDL